MTLIKPTDICDKCCLRCSNYVDHWLIQLCDICHTSKNMCKKCN